MGNTGSAQVIAGFDGSPDARRALVWAADLARVKKAPLHVVVAMGDLRMQRVTDLDVDWEQAYKAELSADAHATVDALGLDDVSVEISPYAPAPVILGEADEATVVVMGSRGHGRLAEAFIGSVSQHIAHHAPCTVVVVREPSDPASRTVVVGVDGSAGGRAALDLAFDYASARGAPVRAVYVSQGSLARLSRAHERPVTEGDEELAAARPVILQALEPYVEKYPDVEVHTDLMTGSVVRALSDASEHAALVVVGSRGRGAFESLLLGSVGQGLLHHARCPVAIAR
jgi:nucleotide-binding universal stress UspA family protein